MIMNKEVKERLKEIETRIDKAENILSDCIIKINTLNSHFESLERELNVKLPTMVETITELSGKVNSLSKICVKQAEEIQILNAKVGDKPIHVEIDNEFKEAEKDQKDYQDQLTELLAQFEN